VSETNAAAPDVAALEKLATAQKKIREQIARVVVGQDSVVEQLLVSILAGGHCILEGVPGLAKTLLVHTLAQSVSLDFGRIQFTPDLMPADITGTDVMDEEPGTGKHRVSFMPGPVFTNFLLADEINRTPPKTQAALLQAMQEGEVSVGRETYKLKPPFFVVATQNPIEMEGTYPLPEAQLDRFMFNLKVKYPTVEEEIQIIKGTTSTIVGTAGAVLKADDVLRLQDLVRGVPVADSVIHYAARLVSATRPGVNSKAATSRPLDGIHKYISYGASPRASQFLVLGSKARAILAGKYHVDFDDVKSVAHAVLRHRLVLNFHARADNVDSDVLVNRLLEAVPTEGTK
jgi:MoxR-like ATPase